MTFPPQVEVWRATVELVKFTAMPTDALLAWGLEESDGNECAIGLIGHDAQGPYNREAGFGQQYFETRDANVGGVTIADLRVNCGSDPHNQHRLRPLTDDERLAHVTALVTDAKDQLDVADGVLAKVGATWSDPERWCLAKLGHGLPVIRSEMLPAAPLGYRHSWRLWWKWINGLSLADVERVAPQAVPYMERDGLDRFRRNAETVGCAVGALP